MIKQISDYQVQQAVTIVKQQLRKLEQDNDLDKKRIVESTDAKLQVVQERFGTVVSETRRDFNEEIKSMLKSIARHKSDTDIILGK